jgi:hypothetical protein
MAFVVLCARHRNRLLDRCPRCHQAVGFHRARLDRPITQCHCCRFDLRRAPAVHLRRQDIVLLRLQGNMLRAVREGFTELGPRRVYAHHYLQIVRQLLRTLAARRTRRLWRAVVAERGGVDSRMGLRSRPRFDVEQLEVQERFALLGGVAWLLDRWPARFIRVCTRARCWSSDLLRDMPTVPYWYQVVVRDWLYRPSYSPSDIEFLKAREYLRSRERRARARDIAHALGVTDAVRKHPNRRALQ